MKLYPRVLTLALAALLLMLAPAAANAAKAKKISVSLGDSLSVGVQPQPNGQNKNTGDGYPAQLAKLAGTRQVSLGCGFATSASIYEGKRPCSPARKTPYRNTSAATSQLAYAEKYIKANRDRIQFVTINLGANDVASCAQGGKLDVPCVTAGLERIKKNLPKVAKRLRKAGGKNMTIAGTTLYNPFLFYWFENPGLAQATVQIAKDQFNAELIKAWKSADFKIARVDNDFQTSAPFSQTTTYNGRAGVPVSVANVCKWTWMCAPTPRGPNIHANKAGYSVMAKAFQKAIGKKARR